MSAYFITAAPGSGKSTIIRALKELGLSAFDTDDIPGVTGLEDKTTHRPIDWPNGPVDWTKYDWNWQPERVNYHGLPPAASTRFQA
jgi:hypothetical protein